MFALVQKDAETQKEREVYGRIKTILKGNLKTVVKNCGAVDSEKKGYLRKEEFEKMVFSLKMSNDFLSEKYAKMIYKDFITGNGEFDYLRFIDYLKRFDFSKSERVNSII